MSNYIATSKEEAAKLREDIQQYGAFQVEKLFSPEEWFRFTALAPKLRSYAIATKLREHPEYIASNILRCEKTKDVYEILVSRKSGEPAGCIDVGKLLTLSRDRPQIVRAEAVALQTVKTRKDEIINEARSNIINEDKIDSPSVSPAPESTSSHLPVDVLRDIRVANANMSYPIGDPKTIDIDELSKSLHVVYPEIMKDIDAILNKPVSSRDYSALAPHLETSSELSTYLILSLAKDNVAFEHFKSNVDQWSRPEKYSEVLLPVILLDPTTTYKELQDILPKVTLSPMQACKYFSSPNALLYGIHLSTKVANKEPVSVADKAFYTNACKSLGVNNSSAIGLLNSILNSPTRSLHNIYYNVLENSSVIEKGKLSDRSLRHISRGDIEWVKSEHEYLIDKFTTPEPKISMEHLDKLSLGCDSYTI